MWWRLRQIFQCTAILTLLNYISAILQVFMQVFRFHYIEDLVLFGLSHLWLCVSRFPYLWIHIFLSSLFHSVGQNYHFLKNSSSLRKNHSSLATESGVFSLTILLFLYLSLLRNVSRWPSHWFLVIFTF